MGAFAVMNRRNLWPLVFFCLAAAPAIAQIPAFSGAEGAGAFATGGRPVEKLNYFPTPTMPVLERRGVVYHVTTLASDPTGVIEGSLRYGLRTENWWYKTHPFRDLNVDDPDSFDVTPRIIVFDVGGTINLGEVDITPMNFTIAGQTAPGGITIYGGEFNPGHRDAWDNGNVYPDKTNNMILRNFAIRTNDSNEKDGLWIPATNSIADHLSMSWYTDEGVSITDAARNVTVQHSIIGPGWNNPDGDGSQIEGKTPMADISVHHNLYLHNDARIPRVGEKTFTSGGPGVELDFRNNVIYNWNDGRAGYGVSGENSFSNFVNNYYIGGAGSGSTTILDVPGGAAGLTHRVYQSGNLMDQNKNGAADGSDLGWAAFAGGEAQQGAPYAVPHGVTQTPAEALETVKNFAGSRWWDRDFLDARAINQLMTFGNSALPISQRGQVLSTIDPADVSAVTGAPMQTRPAGWDTDNDGMPNDWELEHGLDPDSPVGTPDWNLDFDNDGYINVEEYINEIAEWPAPYDVVFGGGTNNRYAQITNWGITRPSPSEANTTTNWQPSRFDVAVINNSTVVVDAVGQHAGKLLLGTNSGDNATLNITAGRLEVEDETAGPGNGEIVIGAHASATAILNLSGGELSAKTLSKGAGGAFNFTGGTLHASTVNFDLENNGGTIAPGNSPGITQVLGDLTLNDGTLEIEIGGTTFGQFDRVEVSGVTILGGTLKVVPIDLGGGTYVPQLGDQFAFLASSGGTGGMFDDFDLPVLDAGLEWALLPGNVTTFLAVVAAPVLAGDYNDDGTVDADDYTVWRDNMGGTSLANETASLGVVDGEDYDAWKANFGASSGLGAGANHAVPEPATMLSAILGILYLFSLASASRRRYSS
jgi:hypothetical protein